MMELVRLVVMNWFGSKEGLRSRKGTNLISGGEEIHKF